MKAKQYLKMLAVAARLPACVLSCTDAWDDHYGDGSGAGTTADAPTLLEHVQADAQLSEFLRVAKHVGYDAVLASPQSLTLWAPVITKAQADSIIAVYESQIIAARLRLPFEAVQQRRIIIVGQSALRFIHKQYAEIVRPVRLERFRGRVRHVPQLFRAFADPFLCFRADVIVIIQRLAHCSDRNIAGGRQVFH